MTQLYLDASELQQPQNCRGGLPLETYENDKTWHRMTSFWRNWKPLLFWTSVCQIQKLQRCTLDPFLDPFPKSRDCVRDFKHIIAHNLSRCCSWTSSAMVSIRPMQRAELRPRCNMMQMKSATFLSLHSCQRWSWFDVYIWFVLNVQYLIWLQMLCVLNATRIRPNLPTPSRIHDQEISAAARKASGTYWNQSEVFRDDKIIENET